MHCALQYLQMKEALLKTYNLTKEGYQNRFRRVKPEQDESALQFIVRLQTTLISGLLQALTNLLQKQYVTSW